MYGVCHKIICDAPATLSVKGLMMVMMMMMMMYGVPKCGYESVCAYFCVLHWHAFFKANFQ